MYRKKFILLFICVLCFLFSKEQTISDFENLSFPADTFWNGKAQPFGTNFSSGNVSFYNYYDTAFGGFWVNGWAYSSKKDTTNATYSNLYSVISGSGYNSLTYAVGQDESRIKLTGQAKGKEVSGMYINNTTFAYKVMKNGNAFAKKFGGPSGNDPDYLRLTIKGWLNGNIKPDSVNFYLADFRNNDNTKDYIVNTWQWANLLALGNVDSLSFAMTTTDTGQFGANTPLFFAIDNFTTRDFGSGIEKAETAVKIFPNPAMNEIHIKKMNGGGQLPVFAVQNILGETILNGSFADETTIDIFSLPKGIYFVTVSDGTKSQTQKIVKL